MRIKREKANQVKREREREILNYEKKQQFNTLSTNGKKCSHRLIKAVLKIQQSPGARLLVQESRKLLMSNLQGISTIQSVATNKSLSYPLSS